MQKKKMMAVLIGICLALGTLSGCGKTQKEASDGKKTLVIGDVSFNSANEEADINPHNMRAGLVSVMVSGRLWSSIPTIWRLSHGWQRHGKMSIH